MQFLSLQMFTLLHVSNIRFHPTSHQEICLAISDAFDAALIMVLYSRRAVCRLGRLLFGFPSKLMITFRLLLIALAIFDTEKFSLDNNKTVCISLFVSFLLQPIFYKYFTI